VGERDRTESMINQAELGVASGKILGAFARDPEPSRDGVDHPAPAGHAVGVEVELSKEVDFVTVPAGGHCSLDL